MGLIHFLINLFVLPIVSMRFTSHLRGGVDFGDPEAAVFKAATLAFAVGAVAVGFGPEGVLWLFPVLWIGFKFLFRISFLESLVLVVVMTGLSILVGVLFMVITPRTFR